MRDMERKIARFNERITIQKNETVVDEYKNHINAWLDYYSCYTYASTYQYDQEEEAATTREEQTINFEVRYCTELKDLDSTHYRVSFHGKPYDIQSVDMMNYQRKTIRIVCKLDAAQKKGAKA